MKNITTLLQDYGLSEVESKIYLKMLEIGPSSVLELARKCDLNRSTTHINTEDLIKKGLATEITKGKKRLIIPEPPEKLSIVIENEKYTIKRKEENLGLVVQSIYDSISSVKENTSSEVKYYKDKKSIERVYDELLQSKFIKSYVNLNKISEIFPENLPKFINAARRGVQIWDLQEELTDKSDTKGVAGFLKLQDEISNYKIKYMPNHVKINFIDYLITEDRIVIVQGGDELVGIVIKNKALAQNSAVIYDLLWSFL